MVEGMAQLAGLVIEEGVRREFVKNVKALMSIIEKAKFRKRERSRAGDQHRVDGRAQGTDDPMHGQ